MDEPKPVYLFRSEGIAPGSGTVMCAAPVDIVVKAFGGGGHHDQEGVRAAFGGNAFFRSDDTGECFLGVRGARNASRFRTALRRFVTITVVRQPPPARLAWTSASSPRPPTSAQRGIA